MGEKLNLNMLSPFNSTTTEFMGLNTELQQIRQIGQ